MGKVKTPVKCHIVQINGDSDDNNDAKTCYK